MSSDTLQPRNMDVDRVLFKRVVVVLQLFVRFYSCRKESTCVGSVPFLGQRVVRTELDSSLIVYGCGSKPMKPFWGRSTTHFSLFE